MPVFNVTNILHRKESCRYAMKKLLLCFFISVCIINSYAQDSLHSRSKAPQIALVGVLIVNVFELDMVANSFYADFYLWCRWKGNINPLKNLEFNNSVEQWGFAKTDLHDSAILLKNGYCYNSIHVQGKFSHSFVLNNYPFDEQKISVHLENSMYTSDQLVYCADTANSTTEKGITIPGWEIKKFGFDSKEHKYSTNFGLPENADNDSYNNFSFSLTLFRPLQYFFWKLLLPIIIVVLSGLGATIIHPRYVDARIYAPVGALLTTVFLQQSYSSQLPDISYLILTDKIYVIVYIMILSGIYHAIYTANLIKDGSDEMVEKAIRLDKLYVYIVIAVLLISSLVLVI